MSEASGDSQDLLAMAKIEPANLSSGSLWKAIWRMSYPLLISTVSNSTIGIADVQVAKYLGTISQASVGIGEQVLFLFEVIIISMGVGTTALISKAWGANEKNKAQILLISSLGFTVVLSILLLFIQYFSGGYILKLLNLKPDVLALATKYLQTYSWFYIPFSFVVTFNASFRSIGDAKMQMMVVLTITILNILLDFLLVYLKFPLTLFGTNGIALASITATSIGAVLALFLYTKSALFNLSIFKPKYINFEYIKSIVKIGFPAAIQRMNWVISVFVLFYIFSTCCHSTSAIAAWSVGLRIEALLFMPLVALSLSVTPIVGQSIGAHNYKRAYDATLKVVKVAVSLMLVCSVLMYLASGYLAKLSSLDSETIKLVACYLKFNAVAEPFLAVTMVITGALQGASDTKFAMLISLIANWCIRLPVAYYLALKLGPVGVFIAMVISNTFSTIIMTIYFAKLKWLQLDVLKPS